MIGVVDPFSTRPSSTCSGNQSRLVVAVFIASVFSGAARAEETHEQPPAEIRSLLKAACFECHSGETCEGDLDLKRLPWKLASQENRLRWILVHDRIESGEMPPPQAAAITNADRRALRRQLERDLLVSDRAEVAAGGRGPLRRLTRREYENNLRDLLSLPHLDISDRLPEDRDADGFTKVTETLDMSFVQLEAYIDAADAALRQAVASGIEPVKPVSFRAVGTDLFQELRTHGSPEAMFYAKRGRWVPISGEDRKKIDQTGEQDSELELALFRSATWPYYGYPRGFRATHDGAYRVRLLARAVRQVRDLRIVPAHAPLTMSFRARQPSGPDVSGDVRETGGWIDVMPEPQVIETTIQLRAGETFEYSLLGLPVPHPITSHGGPLYYDFPPMPDGGHRGVAVAWLEVDGPVPPRQWPPASHRMLFGEHPLRASTDQSELAVELVSENPKADAERLLRRFIRQAARQTVPEESTRTYLDLIHAELDGGALLAEAMLKGYQAFLCSGHMLYLHEPRGESTNADYAIASRLSHLLWNSRPDAELLRNARNGKLRDADSITAEAARLIQDQRFRRFVANFTDEWLDIQDLRRDLPDIRLYPEYRKDDYLVDSMERETRAFFTAMVRENLPITSLVDAEFTFVNDSLAAHYDLAPVNGGQMQRVVLPDWSPYGGLLTQASVMKVTGNGTTTSPVVRGAWVMKKLIGQPPPPPPEKVPAIEPDIRGASTIRELLAKHTTSAECKGCHARFDPVGFALENFDIMGAWRDRYRGLEHGEKITGIDRAGHAFEYRVGSDIDASGTLLGGREFNDIHELKALLVAEPRNLARNLLGQLTLYATGTPIRFSDRPEIEAILDRCKPSGYGVQDLLLGLIGSPVFTNRIDAVPPDGPASQ